MWIATYGDLFWLDYLNSSDWYRVIIIIVTWTLTNNGHELIMDLNAMLGNNH